MIIETSSIFSEMLGIKKVAEIMGVHQRKVYRMVNEGKMPGFKWGGKGKWVFESAIIKQWITQQTSKKLSI